MNEKKKEADAPCVIWKISDVGSVPGTPKDILR